MRTTYYILFLIGLLVSCNDKSNNQTEVVNTSDSLVQASQLIEINNRIRKDPNNANFYNERADYYKKNGMLEEGLNDMKRIMQIDSNVSSYRYSYGELLFVAKNIKEASYQFKKAFELDPSNEDAILKLAELEFLLQQNQTALDYLDEVIKLNQYNGKAYMMKGYVFLSQNDTARAASSFETAREVNKNDYASNIELAKLYEARNDPRAIDYYNTAIDIDPLKVEAFYHRGYFAQNNGQKKLAINSYELIIKISETEQLSLAEAFLVQQAYYNLGYIYLTFDNDLQQAAKMFDLAIQINPEDADALYNRGYVSELQGDYNQAKTFYLMALKANPQHDLAAKSLSIVMEQI